VIVANRSPEPTVAITSRSSLVKSKVDEHRCPLRRTVTVCVWWPRRHCPASLTRGVEQGKSDTLLSLAAEARGVQESSGSAQCVVLKVNASVRKLLSTIEANLVSPARNREWTAHVAMPAAKEPLEDGLYSKYHNLLHWQFVLHFQAPSRWPAGQYSGEPLVV
jgi:hypothetical protein